MTAAFLGLAGFLAALWVSIAAGLSLIDFRELLRLALTRNASAV
jgi:hypothetical protein